VSNLLKIKLLLDEASAKDKLNTAIFFKSGLGQYSEHDKFNGVSVPTLRKIAKNYINLSLDEILILIQSPINEERLLALIILTKKYELGDKSLRKQLYDFYINNIKYINNWNLVDSSAHLIIGRHLFDLDKSILYSLAESNIMWERRISIVSTWFFIKNHQFKWTLKVAEKLLSDKEDLIHKAVGWMLREVGKRDKEALKSFLDMYVTRMPRTMLRYAIEKLSEDERKYYLLYR
jgi:3-methyladenine DNA glycosylase AlkD